MQRRDLLKLPAMALCNGAIDHSASRQRRKAHAATADPEIQQAQICLEHARVALEATGVSEEDRSEFEHAVVDEALMTVTISFDPHGVHLSDSYLEHISCHPWAEIVTESSRWNDCVHPDDIADQKNDLRATVAALRAAANEIEQNIR